MASGQVWHREAWELRTAKGSDTSGRMTGRGFPSGPTARASSRMNFVRPPCGSCVGREVRTRTGVLAPCTDARHYT